MEPKQAHKPWSWKEWEAYHWRASLPNWHASGVGFTVCVCGCLLETCHKHISVSFEDIKYPQWKAMKSEQSTHCANKVVRHAVEASPFWKPLTQLERSMVAKSTKSDRIWQIFTSPLEAAGIQGRCSCGASQEQRVGTCWSIDPHRPRAETLETGCPPRWNCSSFIGLNSEKTMGFFTESNTGSIAFWKRSDI